MLAEKSQIDLDELREVIGSVSSIGEVRLNQIMYAIAAFYNSEEKAEQEYKIAARSDERTAIFCFRFEKERNKSHL